MCVPMAAYMSRLIALVALLLMPFGMTAAPALAQQPGHSAAMAGHCGDQPDRGQSQLPTKEHCAVCGALPAADSPAPAPRLKPSMPRTAALAVSFAGIEPETATPPPKTA
jgi:hypothetical protein